MASGQREPLPTIVSPQWLAERLGSPYVKVLDASWYLPSMGRDRIADFKAARIPGARFFDVDGVADRSQGLPHMLPTEAQFGAALDALGINPGDDVIVYDGIGMFSAPRAWWTFRVFGHDRVAVLEGGLTAWRAAGLPLEETPVEESALTAGGAAAAAAAAGGTGGSSYTPVLDRDKVRSVDQVLQLVAQPLEARAAQVVDARSEGRFRGTESEPRAGMRGGRMPGSFNVPFGAVYEGGVLAGAKLKSPPELARVFAAAGVDISQPVVASCGSGMTACVLALALHQATASGGGGGVLAAVYDGSWSEWGGRPDTPIVSDAGQVA